MKSVLEKYTGFAATTAALAAACGSVWAQSIPVPASSADSGRRAVVAVTQPNMANYATKTEVTNAYNLANTANNTANTAQYYGYNAYTNQGGSFGAPWARQFPGQSKFAYSDGLRVDIYIDGNGYTYYNINGTGYNGIGYTSSSSCISTPTGNWGGIYWTATACPTSYDYYGRATNWTVNMASSSSFENAGPGNGSE